MPLNDQELLNATYSGRFVTLAKAEFSNSQNADIQKWSAYIRGSANRQAFLERALDCVSRGDIASHMSAHRNDADIEDLKSHFENVVDWVSMAFEGVYPEMQGLGWGRLYEEHRKRSFNPKEVPEKVERLLSDDAVKNRKGIIEYLLGGKVEARLLDLRLFETPAKRRANVRQTIAAKEKGESNCPLCAVGVRDNSGDMSLSATRDLTTAPGMRACCGGSVARTDWGACISRHSGRQRRCHSAFSATPRRFGDHCAHS